MHHSFTKTGLKVRIETDLFDECLQFYTHHLGMNTLESWDRGDDRGAILGFNTATKGEAFLELAYEASPKSYEGLSLQFRVPNLTSVENKLRECVEYAGPKERPWGSSYLYLTDPAGVSVIIFQGKL